jgi:cytoskeletal protein CcmA (bactofilin family)
MSVPYIFSTVAGGTSIPLSELDENFSYLSVSPTLTSLSLTGGLTVSGTSTFAGLITANGGLSLTGALRLNGAVGSNNQVVYSNAGVPGWTFINPNMLSTGHPTWDATGNLTTIGNITSGTGTFRTTGSPNSQIILGTNNFSVYLNSTDYFNVTPSLTTIPNSLLVTGISSTFNNILNANGGFSLVGSFSANGTTGSSNNVLLISGASPQWGRISPPYLSAGGPAWDSSGNVSATLGMGSGTGTFYNTSSSNCSLTITPTGAITSINGSTAFSVDNLGNSTVTNNLNVGGALAVNGSITASGALSLVGNLAVSGSITSQTTIAATGTVTGSGVVSTSGVFSQAAGSKPNITIAGAGMTLNATAGNVFIDTNGNMQLGGSANAYSISVPPTYTGTLGLYMGSNTNQGSFNYSMGSGNVFISINGGPKLTLDVIGNGTFTGNVASNTGVFAKTGASVNNLTFGPLGATLNVNSVGTLISTTTGTGIIGFVGSSTGIFTNSSTSYQATLSINNTTFDVNILGTTVSQTFANGNMTILGTLTQLSDRLLKTNIVDVSSSDALNKIKSLQAVTYNMKSDPEGHKHLGLIADDVKEVVPEVVFETNVGGENTKSLAYANLVALVIEAIKDIDARLAAKGI